MVFHWSPSDSKSHHVFKTLLDERNNAEFRMVSFLLVWFDLVWFYGISNIVDYLMPNAFLYIKPVLFQIIQFSINTQFKCQKHFYFKLFSLVNKVKWFQINLKHNWFSFMVHQPLEVILCQIHFYTYKQFYFK